MKKFLILLILHLCSTYADSLNVLFVGDTHFGENYQADARYNNGVNAIDEYGYDYFFENIKGILSASDCIVCNLETPLTNFTKIPVSYLKPYLHWSDPVNTIKYFKKYNIMNVNLANNHVFDQGFGGFNETIISLDTAGIKYFGAGNSLFDASKPLIITLKGISAAVFSGFEYRNSYDSLYDFYAAENKPGVGMLDTAGFTGHIRQYKMANPNIRIIIFPHWGSNYKPVNDRQKAMAHNWVDAGADIIIGHGAHTVQEIEYYNGKWIIYNIGNFIFNAPGRYESTAAMPYSFMVELSVNNDGISTELYPLFSDNKLNNYQLRFLDGNELKECMDYVSCGKEIIKVTSRKTFKLIN